MQNAIRTLLLIMLFGPLAAMLLFVSANMAAYDLLEPQTFPNVVKDEDQLLFYEHKINEIAFRLKQNTGSELAVLAIRSLPEDQTIEELAVKNFEKWGIGQKGKDNGLLFVIVGKPSLQIRIEVGYGLEDVITDAHARRIIDHEMVPNVKGNELDAAVHAGVMTAALRIAANKGVDLEKEPETNKSAYIWGLFKGIVFLALLIIFMVKLWHSGGLGDKDGPTGWFFATVIALFALGPVGGFTSIAAKFKGFSAFGGGFGAFGGGASGGGGASFR